MSARASNRATAPAFSSSASTPRAPWPSPWRAAGGTCRTSGPGSSLQRRGEAIAYRSTRTHPGEPAARFEADYAPAGGVFHAEPGTLEHFLTERYCLYASPGSVGAVGERADRLYRAEVHHAPWPLQPAEATIDAGPLLEAAGFDGVTQAGSPHLLFARTLAVRVWPLRRV